VPELQPVSERRGLLAVFATGVALNLGNPKMPLFYVALLPNVVGSSLTPGHVATLAAVILTVEAVVIGGHVILAGRARKPLRTPAVVRRVNRTDIFLCPGDQVLSPRHYGKSRDNVKIDYTNRAACKACHLRERCTKSFRRVSRLENGAVLDRMAARLAARPDILDQRRESVEHPFGTIKQWMNQARS
jgi:hypothetical protein